MGILDRFIKQEILRKSPEQIQLEQQVEDELAWRQSQGNVMGGQGMIGWQPLPPTTLPPIPPQLDHETMKLYLEYGDLPPCPKNKSELIDLFTFTKGWCLSKISVGNLNGHQVKKILRNLQIAQDLIGTDNTQNLIYGKMLKIVAMCTLNRARSDLPDGIRERMVPSVGYGIGETRYMQQQGERPKESRASFGILNKFRGG